MYISLWENYRGHPDNISFMQFSTKIDGFEQKDSQGFENSYNSYEQYPLEKCFIFTIYQNYTLALRSSTIDILTLSETHLDDTVSDGEIAIDGFNCIRRDRNRSGGGVLVYIRDNIHFTVKPEFMPMS